MAPAVAAKSNRSRNMTPAEAPSITQKPIAQKPVGQRTAPLANTPIAPAVREALEKLAKTQAEMLSKSTWVGNDFAEKSRAMHYGEVDTANIHGKATLQDARDLVEEGIGVAPLPFPVAGPDEVN